MTQPPRRSLDELVDVVVGDLWSTPVRAMEAVLERGPAAVEPVARGLERALERRGGPWSERGPTEDGGETLEPLWAAVLLGQLGSPEGAEPLVEAIRRTDEREYTLRQAAAEALARIGTPAMEAIHGLVRSDAPDERLWGYAALGWVEDEAAHERLLDALESDTEMLDVVASAVAARGREEAIPRLHAALERAEPWMRPELEDAIRELAHAEPRRSPLEEDWRLRYRLDPSHGTIPLTWATVSAIVRIDPEFREERVTLPVRPLEEILAEPWEEEPQPERCENCGVVLFEGTGVDVCPETAVSVALIQHEMLGQARAAGFRDLFDLMADLEAELWALDDAPWPVDAREIEAHEDEETRITLLHRACEWLVERGVEEIGAGRAALLAEAGRLADLHGDPEGLLSDGATFRTASPIRAPEEPGRNDPCPCGSGRKYKKCCGAPG